MRERYLIHWGILGMKWGVRRYQNPDGTLTEAGKARYYKTDGSLTQEGRKWQADERKKRLKHPELLTKEELDTEVSRARQENELKRLTEEKSEEYQKLKREIEILELKANKKRLKDQLSGKSNNGGKGKGKGNGGGGKKGDSLTDDLLTGVHKFVKLTSTYEGEQYAKKYIENRNKYRQMEKKDEVQPVEKKDEKQKEAQHSAIIVHSNISSRILIRKE